MVKRNNIQQAMRITQILCFWLVALNVHSQSFEWQVPLDTPQVRGYHDIILPKEIVGRLNHIYTDIRIYTIQGKEIPYLALRDKSARQSFTAQTITITDSASRTHYAIQFAQPCHLSSFAFKIASPQYFLRKAVLKRISQVSKTIHADTIFLNSKKSNRFQVFNYSSLTNCELVVENFDDQPLDISHVKGYQKGLTLVAALKTNQSYLLKFGSPTLKTPIYDIQYFESELPQERPTLGANLLQLKQFQKTIIPKKVATKPPTTETFSKNQWIWGILGTVVFIMGYMTFRMVREIRGN